jgi:hypothetical protein
MTGWRIDSELLSPEWRQLDSAPGSQAGSWKKKKGEGRTFPTTHELREVIEEQ